MKAPSLHPGAALCFQAVIVCVGLVTLSLMLIEPHFEGRNVNATTFEIYFKDPFLAYVYVGSIPFFLALQRAFRLFRHVRRTGTFSEVSVEALRAIRRCGLALIGFVAGAAVFIAMFGDREDRPPGIFMCALALLGSTVIATAAASLGRRLESALVRAETRAA